MKRFSLFLSLLLVVFCLYLLPLEAQAVEAVNGTCGDNITWSLAPDGRLTISGTGEINDYEYSEDIPWYGYRNDILSVVINEGITEVCARAFASCSNITSVTLPESLTRINAYTFYQCKSLIEVNIPNSVTYIGENAFANCSALESVVNGSGLKNIDDYAFYACSKLSNFVFGNKLTEIGEKGFANCRSLSSITIPASVTALYSQAFNNCEGLKEIYFEGDAPSVKGSYNYVFYNVTATAYYPANNDTWTAEKIQGYESGNKMTWEAREISSNDSNSNDSVGEGNYSGDVTGSYVAGVESNGTVYSIDITWTVMNFTYHAADEPVWDVETHQYVTTNEAYWEGTGTITVTNHSNAKINAVPSYTAKEGYESTDMTFSADMVAIPSAADNNQAETGVITVTPTGSLPKMEQTDTIGFITITITPST